MKKIFVLGCCSLLAVSCVSVKQYNSARADAMKAQNELQLSGSGREDVIERNNRLVEQVEKLATDTARLMRENREIQEKYRKLLSSSSSDVSKLLRQLEENEKEIKELKMILGED